MPSLPSQDGKWYEAYLAEKARADAAQEAANRMRTEMEHQASRANEAGWDRDALAIHITTLRRAVIVLMADAHSDGVYEAGEKALAATLDTKLPLLAKDNAGMRYSIEGIVVRAAEYLKRDGEHASGLGAMLRDEVLKHLRELASRYYAGDIAVVDEFLQLYAIGESERTALVEHRKERV